MDDSVSPINPLTLHSEEHWDLIIQPKAHLLDLKLKEVWRYRDLLLLFVKRDFVTQYKQTILGPLWYFIQPIFTSIIFLMVFGKIANIPTDGVPPILFYMSGITMWNYFSTCLNQHIEYICNKCSHFWKSIFSKINNTVINRNVQHCEIRNTVFVAGCSVCILCLQWHARSFGNSFIIDTVPAGNDGGHGAGAGYYHFVTHNQVSRSYHTDWCLQFNCSCMPHR